jgi:hypothetical protein
MLWFNGAVSFAWLHPAMRRRKHVRCCLYRCTFHNVVKNRQGFVKVRMQAQKRYAQGQKRIFKAPQRISRVRGCGGDSEPRRVQRGS